MTDEEINQRFAQVLDAQLRFQGQLGDMARIFRDRIEAQDRAIEVQDRTIERLDQAIEEIRQGRVEIDQRFTVLLEEFRYLIRQQRPQEGGSES